jgi:maltose alpha-D-glucosyltransferase/alpha-amylase
MGDNLQLGDRDGMRTPMQWTGDIHGGFASSAASRVVLPVIDDPVAGYQAVNVELQDADSDSLLSRIRRLIQVRRRHSAFGRGAIEFLECSNSRVLAFILREGDDIMVVAANLASSPQSATLTVPHDIIGSPVTEVLGDIRFPPIGAPAYTLALGPRTCYWLTVAGARTGFQQGQAIYSEADVAGA